MSRRFNKPRGVANTMKKGWSHKSLIEGRNGKYVELICNTCLISTKYKPTDNCDHPEHFSSWQRAKSRDDGRYTGVRKSRLILFDKTKYHNLQQQLYLKHNIAKCVCCGSINKIEGDHIVPCQQSYERKGGVERVQELLLLSVGTLQGLCKSCNSSMRNGFFCFKHGKYLGPKLENIGNFVNELNTWSLKDGIAFSRTTKMNSSSDQIQGE